MLTRQFNIFVFIIFSLVAINFSAYTALNFFGIDERQYKPFLMYINVMGFFVIMLPRQKGLIVKQLNTIIT